MNYPDDLLAYRLLKAANLESTHEKLIKATISDLKYDEVRSKLVKIFSDESADNFLESAFSSMNVKSEPTFYNKESSDEDKHNFSDDEENVYNVKRGSRFYKSKPTKIRSFQKRSTHDNFTRRDSD